MLKYTFKQKIVGDYNMFKNLLSKNNKIKDQLYNKIQDYLDNKNENTIYYITTSLLIFKKGK